MNLIDKDKLLYELSCAILSECSQDDYEHIEDIINEQPIIRELNDTVVNNKDKRSDKTFESLKDLYVFKL